jgi:hypothetical protein
MACHTDQMMGFEIVHTCVCDVFIHDILHVQVVIVLHISVRK